MSRFSFIALLLAVCLYALPSMASVVVWQDPQTKLTASYPDRWHKELNHKPDEVLRVLADAGDKAECRLRVREEGRFRMYPGRFDDEIQRLGFSTKFWQSYIAEQGSGRLFYVRDDAGFGRGNASIAEAAYTPASGQQIEKRSIMLVSFYGEQVYIGECSAASLSFEKWRNNFMSFLKSVDFRKVDHELLGGNYRNLHKEGKVRVHGPTPKDDMVY